MSQTPLSLLERLRSQGEPKDWNWFVQLYSPLIRSWLHRHRMAQVDVDDLTQDVLVVVVQEVPHFQHDGRAGAFRSWLRQVTVNRLRTWWRSRHRHPQGTGDSDFLEMLDQLEDTNSALSRRWDQEHDHYVVCQLLQLVQGDFEPPTWRAFQRLALDEAPAAEVARELGMSVNAVLLAKSRVLRRLRQELDGLVD
jgi:RNA polymerase sigma-70 factor (ECF subfamily)